MNKNTIIHIGLHKTGTTYLQYNFFPYLKNVLYAHGNSFFVPWKEQVKANNSHMLLSYEGFSGTAWNRDWIMGKPNDHSWLKSFETNVHNLKKFFPEATIIVFFRKHGDLLLSMYKQYLHEGGTLPFEEFYNKGKIVNEEDLNFTRRIDILNENFENVFYLNYETFRKKGNEYLTEFFKMEFGIGLTERNGASTQKNKSISGSKLELLRKVNHPYGKIPVKLRKLLRFARLSPRDILQSRLSFWQPMDLEKHLKIRDQVNLYFQQDWEYFESVQWRKSE